LQSKTKNDDDKEDFIDADAVSVDADGNGT
jgi:hypothetical protein